MTFIQTIKQTWKTYWKNKKDLTVAGISDFLFYTGIIILMAYIVNRLLDLAEQVFNTVGDLTSNAAMQSPQVISQYKEINQIMLILFGGILLIWIVFKGISWWQAHETLGERIKPTDFIKKFILTSITFYAILLAIGFLAIYTQYRDYITDGQGSVMQTMAIGIITLILILITFYFGTIAYATIEQKKPIRKAFVLGIKKWKQIIPAYLLSSAVFTLSLILFFILLIQPNYSVLGIAILILLPEIQYFRLLMINSIKKR